MGVLCLIVIVIYHAFKRQIATFCMQKVDNKVIYILLFYQYICSLSVWGIGYSTAQLQAERSKDQSPMAPKSIFYK